MPATRNHALHPAAPAAPAAPRSAPQRPAPATTNLPGADAEDLALYRDKFRRRLPQSLEELRGPPQGAAEPPPHMARSGMTSYDIDKPRRRTGPCRTVLHKGLREDLPRHLNQDLPLQMRPVLPTLPGRTLRTVREDVLRPLTRRTRAAA
ncbi:hypothetical protein ACWEQ2_31480 [Streptomyces sp. NPDC004096]